MNKVIYIIIFTIGSINLLFSQLNVSDSLEYVPNKFVETLLKENDSLQFVFSNTKDKLTKEQIINIFSKTENKEYDVKKTQIALQLTSLLGDNWNFDETLKSKNKLNFNTLEEFAEFANSRPISVSTSHEKDGSLIRQETTYKNGSKEIIEKDKNGKYIIKKIDEFGIENVEEIKDNSKYQMITPKTKIIKE